MDEQRTASAAPEPPRSSASPTGSSTTGPAPTSSGRRWSTRAAAAAAGSYAYHDLLELKVIKKLLDAGIRLESVRDVFDYLRNHVDADISSAHIVIDGSSVLLCEGDELDRRRPPRPGRAPAPARGRRSRARSTQQIVALRPEDDGARPSAARSRLLSPP